MGGKYAIYLAPTLICFSPPWKLHSRQVHALYHARLRSCNHLPPPRRAPQLPRCNSSTRRLPLLSFWYCSQLRWASFYPCRWEWNSTPRPNLKRRQEVSRPFWTIAIFRTDSPLMRRLLGARLPCQQPSLACLAISRRTASRSS